MGSLFDIIIWLLVIYFIFGGSKKKKTKRPAQPKQAPRPDLYEIPREEPAVKPAEVKPAQTTPAQTTPAKPAARPDVKAYTSLGDLLRDMVQDFRTVLGEEKMQNAQPPAERRPRRRREKAKPQPVDGCDYCTGEVAPTSVFTEHASAAAPKAVDAAVQARTVETACRELGLNPMQQAFVWKEILDEPVALRK